MTRPTPSVLSLAQLLVQQPAVSPPGLVDPVLPAHGILFVGGEPKVGKSLLVANLALALAAGTARLGFAIAAPRRVLVCQFELPVTQFVSRLVRMRPAVGPAADEHLLVDTHAAGHLLSADQDENDTRAMAALCQALLRLRDASQAALVVVHHVRKSIGRHEIGSAFRGSSALHAVGDSYVLLTRPSPHVATVELRFQFRYAAPEPPRVLALNPQTLWFAPTTAPAAAVAPRRKVEPADVTHVLETLGKPVRYSELRGEIMQRTACSKRTAQVAIADACRRGGLVSADGQYRLPL